MQGPEMILKIYWQAYPTLQCARQTIAANIY